MAGVYHFENEQKFEKIERILQQFVANSLTGKVTQIKAKNRIDGNMSMYIYDKVKNTYFGFVPLHVQTQIV